MPEQDFALADIGILELLTVAEPVKIVLEAPSGHPVKAADEFLQAGVQGVYHVDVPCALVLRADCRVRGGAKRSKRLRVRLVLVGRDVRALPDTPDKGGLDIDYRLLASAGELAKAVPGSLRPVIT